MNNDIEINSFVDSHVAYIRKMAMLTDDQLRYLFKMKAMEDPSILDKFKEVQMKKQLQELKTMATDIKTTPLKLGRKVA